MRVQVLVAAMNQNDDSLVKKMNIKTDALIGNQCSFCSNTFYQYDGYNVQYYNRPDRGVGVNRNTTLLHSSNNCILTFADDDMVFFDDYDKLIIQAFENIPDADAIIFNIKTVGKDVGRRENKQIKRVRFYNSLNYGAARLSVKSNSIKRENIWFHTCFGGGTRYGSGEDTLFITNMIKHGLKIYACPADIAEVNQESSTWFSGYDRKYLYDKGALYAAISHWWAWLLCLQDLLRHRQTYKNCNMSLKSQYKTMIRGIRDFQVLDSFTSNKPN